MKIEFTSQHGKLIAYLEGELDEHSSHQLREGLDRKIAAGGFSMLILNMSQVEFMDSTGIGVLLGRYKKLSRLGVPLCVQDPTLQVDKILRMSGLYQIIRRI